MADEKDALAALNALAKHAKLPVKFKNTEDSVPVKVPKGFASLFERISINLRWSGRGCYVDWKYEHPQGGRNGYAIGFIVKEDTGRWGWRSESGDYGYV